LLPILNDTNSQYSSSVNINGLADDYDKDKRSAERSFTPTSRNNDIVLSNSLPDLYLHKSTVQSLEQQIQPIQLNQESIEEVEKEYGEKNDADDLDTIAAV
jgi:hypothetical protein